MAEDIQGYLAACCSSFLTCHVLHFFSHMAWVIIFSFLALHYLTHYQGIAVAPLSERPFGGKASSVFISRRVYRCCCRVYFCEVSASLALFRFVFLLPADSRLVSCRSEQKDCIASYCRRCSQRLTKPLLFSVP